MSCGRVLSWERQHAWLGSAAGTAWESWHGPWHGMHHGGTGRRERDGRRETGEAEGRYSQLLSWKPCGAGIPVCWDEMHSVSNGRSWKRRGILMPESYRFLLLLYLDRTHGDLPGMGAS